MAYGDIGTAKTDVVVRTGSCQNPRIIRVGAGVFAVFYYDNVHNICVKTYSSDAAGNITGISTTDTVVDAAGLTDLNVIHIAGTVYALIYYGASNIGRLTTVDIAEDGTINDANIASFTWQAGAIFYPFICPVRGDIYAITHWRNPPNSGRLRTISISQDGATLAPTDEWEFEVGVINFSCCFKLSDGYITVAYNPSVGHANMFSVAISDAGVISKSRITNWICSPMVNAFWPIKLASQQYALTCTGTDSDGFLVSVTVADNGVITQSWDDQLEFDTDYCATNQILSLGGIYHAVCFKDAANHWRLATFWIEPDGEIRNSNIDTYDHNQTSASYASWCWALENIYIVAWEDNNNDIRITPIDIESYGRTPAVPHELMMGIGP